MTAEEIFIKNYKEIDIGKKSFKDYMIQAMKEYAEQEREKAFNAARLCMEFKDEEIGAIILDCDDSKYDSFETYKQHNPLT